MVFQNYIHERTVWADSHNYPPCKQILEFLILVPPLENVIFICEGTQMVFIRTGIPWSNQCRELTPP